MRLIHTSDICLDASFAAEGLSPQAAALCREAARGALASVLAHAQKSAADALLITGNLFSLRGLTRETVNHLREAFESIRPMPVFIVTGDNDPAEALSPYLNDPWPANVVVFHGPGWSSHECRNLPLTVHGKGWSGDFATNPFQGLSIPRDGRAHVVLLHTDASVDASAGVAALEGRAHYVALGGNGPARAVEGSTETVAHFSGAPLMLSAEPDVAGTFLEVNGAKAGDQFNFSVEVHRLAHLHRARVHLDCSAIAGASEALDEVRAQVPHDRDCTLLELQLDGQVTLAFRGELHALKDSLAGDFAAVEILDETDASEDIAQAAAASTSLGAFVARVQQGIAAAPDESRRTLLRRVLDVGAAAYRGQMLPVDGVEGGAP